VEFVRPEYLKKLDYSEDECEEIQALCERLYKIREHSPEPTVYSFLSDLGKIKRSSLTAIEDRLLSVLEQEYGIFDD
jgi:hypothetical protein